jgi:Domain of unknown function (DUF929)
MKRRQRMRRLTLVLTVLVIVVSLGVGVYLLSQAGTSSIDKYINKAVSSSDMAGLQTASAQPYGLSPTLAMRNTVQKYSGTPFVTNGKPTVVYIGGEFCQYCAIERWSLIIALDRFGNFNGLHYMASAADEGDYATFSFAGSTYTSNYISFRPFEAEDRNSAPLQTVPSNYSAVWTSYGSGFPFMDFGNAYVVSSSLIADPGIIAGMNWTSIIANVQSGGAAGQDIIEAANMFTSVICKITNNSPASVCTASPIGSTTQLISAPAEGSLLVNATSASTAPTFNAVPSRLFRSSPGSPWS